MEVPTSSSESGEEQEKELRGTGRLSNPKTGEWVEVGRLRKIMG